MFYKASVKNDENKRSKSKQINNLTDVQDSNMNNLNSSHVMWHKKDADTKETLGQIISDLRDKLALANASIDVLNKIKLDLELQVSNFKSVIENKDEIIKQ